MTSDGDLLCSVRDRIGLLQLNRPQFHNAITRSMWNEIPLRLEQLDKEEAAVVIITGSGNSFASGADLSELEGLSSQQQAREQWLSIKRTLDFVARFPLPTIAMINGACIGGGCLLALSCDMRFAAEHAAFGIPVAKLGIVLDDEAIFRLTRLVGAAMASELLFTAGTISGARARATGLVNDACAGDRLQERVNSIAESIVDNATQSIVSAKESIRRSVETGCLDNEAAVVASYVSDEFRRRIRSVLNKS